QFRAPHCKEECAFYADDTEANTIEDPETGDHRGQSDQILLGNPRRFLNNPMRIAAMSFRSYFDNEVLNLCPIIKEQEGVYNDQDNIQQGVKRTHRKGSHSSATTGCGRLGLLFHDFLLFGMADAGRL